MRVAALSLAGVRLDTVDSYRADLVALLKREQPCLAVLPALSALLLGLRTGNLPRGVRFEEICKNYLAKGAAWNDQYLNLHSSIAAEVRCYLAAGTIFEEADGRFFHAACGFSPRGELLLQRQTHLTLEERELGFSRGEELSLFDLDGLQAGFVVGNDARHPEVSRIYALRGADVLIHSGAVTSRFYCWPQAAGMWAQVQQNQFWAVEARLRGAIGKKIFGGTSAVIGPCEITPGRSGYLSRSYPDTPLISAALDESARQAIKKKYPLLEMLNPAAYKDLFG